MSDHFVCGITCMACAKMSLQHWSVIHYHMTFEWHSRCCSETSIIWTSERENLSSGFANNKGADQSAHPHS